MSEVSKQEAITEVPLNKWQAFKKEWGGFIILLLCLFTFRSVIADWNAVPTGSMKPTILEGDRIWVNKLAYGLRVPFTNIRVATLGQPARGEIVVFPEPQTGKRYIKRVIGVAGDKVEIRDNRVYVNDFQLDYQPYSPEQVAQFGRIPDSPNANARRIDPLYMTETLDGKSYSVSVLTPYSSWGPKIVPEGRFFAMGDNRDESRDSRYIGFIDSDTLIGKATRVAWSHDYDNYYFFRKERFFKPIDELPE